MSKKKKHQIRIARQSQELGENIENKSNTLITRRKAIQFVIAAAAVIVGVKIISGDDKIDSDNQTQKPVNPDIKSKKDLNDVIQDTIIFPDGEKKCVTMLNESYDVSREIGALNFTEAIKNYPDEFNMSAEELEEIKIFMAEFEKTGFSSQLRGLINTNKGHSKKGEILFIPFVHGAHHEIGTSMETKRRKGWDDVARILEIECDGPHKVFFEGESGNDLVHNQWLNIIADKVKASIAHTSTTREEIRRAFVDKYKASRFGQMVFNPNLNIFGLENEGLIDLVRRYKPTVRQEKYNGSFFVNGFYLPFMDGLLREQFAVEKTVYSLQPGEKSVIVMGAIHSSTIMKYIKDKHPSLSARMLIPKHLYLPEDYK